MSNTPNADLIKYARSRGVHLSDFGARKMRTQRGEDGAQARVDALGALMDLAGALDQKLTTVAAARKLDACGGNYDDAAARLVGRVRAVRMGVFDREWKRLEDLMYARDAHLRHAVLLDGEGSLGWRTSVMLLAAEDAGLHSPAAAAYRIKVVRAVDAEILRRYPSRREDEWQVVDPDSRHPQLVERAIADDRYARDLMLKAKPEMQQRIDLLASSATMRKEIEAVIREIQLRLEQKTSEEGWRPNPERYRREVVQAAWAAAREAQAA